MEIDRSLLLRAVEIAHQGIQNGGGPFGSVVSRDDKIISEAYNMVVLTNDPTAHAEIIAIRQAAIYMKSHTLSKCTLYSSCEPCPMCLGAIYWSGIGKVVYASDRIDAAEAGFIDKLIYEEIMLDPAKREITFIRLNDAGGKDVFRKWKELGNMIPY